MLLILIVLVYNTFKEKLRNLLETETFDQIYLEGKHMIQYSVDIFALDLLVLCLKVKA